MCAGIRVPGALHPEFGAGTRITGEVGPGGRFEVRVLAVEDGHRHSGDRDTVLVWPEVLQVLVDVLEVRDVLVPDLQEQVCCHAVRVDVPVADGDVVRRVVLWRGLDLRGDLAPAGYEFDRRTGLLLEGWNDLVPPVFDRLPAPDGDLEGVALEGFVLGGLLVGIAGARLGRGLGSRIGLVLTVLPSTRASRDGGRSGHACRGQEGPSANLPVAVLASGRSLRGVLCWWHWQ